jgi:hypothetical protein
MSRGSRFSGLQEKMETDGQVLVQSDGESIHASTEPHRDRHRQLSVHAIPSQSDVLRHRFIIVRGSKHDFAVFLTAFQDEKLDRIAVVGLRLSLGTLLTIHRSSPFTGLIK